jgi:5-methylcytosine-specific restriction endonuclease McrA
MSFFQTDDQFHIHRKPAWLIDEYGAATGLAAVGLWVMAGSQSQGKYTDGLVSTADLQRITLDKRQALRLAKLLVDAGLWHAADHDCTKCSAVPAGSFRFHDWWDIGYATGAQTRETRARRKEVRDPKIVNAVWARDGSNCRYCGRKVNRDDHKSAHKPVLDHVIPGIAKGAANLVVTCTPCNQKKAQRTPEQAGMTLRPAPAGGSTTESSAEPNGSSADRDRIPAVPHRQGQGHGSGSGSGVGQGPAGEAPAVDVPGPFGSPWFGHHGPPSDVEVPHCADHGHEMPCRKCTSEHYAEEAS